MYAIPVREGGVRYGTVVAAVPLGPYRASESRRYSAQLRWPQSSSRRSAGLSSVGTRPSAHPRPTNGRSAAQWSRDDLDQRFDLGEPRDEFTRLAATLDTLLERIAESLRHEQRFTAEISHELRTPLARVKGETELLLSRPRSNEERHAAFREIARSVEEMTATVDTLVSAARHEAGLNHVTSDLWAAVHSATAAVAPTTSAVSVNSPSGEVPIAAEPELLTRMVQPLIDNACRYARSKVSVEVTQTANSACVSVRDDGPGVRDDEAELVFEPGRRGTAAATAPGAPGAGLGLALARRLARSIGGDITVEPGLSGGHFLLRLPAHL